MSANKGPSVGQKVRPGDGAPIIQESAGSVADNSLAAESILSGGGFAANRGAEPGSEPAQNPRAAKPGASGKPGASNPNSLENMDSYAGAAPSYINRGAAQADTAGPHGRNLTEGGFQGSGTAGGPLPEPGSKKDPARLAIGADAAGNSRQTRSRDTESQTTEQGFEALRRDESA